MLLVTGGAGMIGSNLVAGLNEKGRKDIVIVDNMGQADKFRNLNALDFHDLAHKDNLDQVLAFYKDSLEVVFHQGACSATTEKDSNYLLANNFEVSKKLFNFCQEHDIPFIYASSASVYGNGENGFAENRRNEDPLNGYAFSKHLFDQWIRDHKDQISSPVVGLRYFNVYGPQENHKGRMASVIWQFHQQIQKEGKIRLFEGSDQFLRDFIHVDDVVRANLHFMESHVSGIFNVGTGAARSFLDIAKVMQEENPGTEIEFIPFPDDLKGKYQAFTQADLTEITNTNFDNNFVNLEDGVRSYARILRESNGYLIHPSRR